MKQIYADIRFNVVVRREGGATKVGQLSLRLKKVISPIKLGKKTNSEDANSLYEILKEAYDLERIATTDPRQKRQSNVIFWQTENSKSLFVEPDRLTRPRRIGNNASRKDFKIMNRYAIQYK